MLFFPLVSFGQTNKKIPEFIQPSSIFIMKKDTLVRECFCFNKLDKPIFNPEFENIDIIKYCNVYEKKYYKNIRTYTEYDKVLKKDNNFKKIAEYFNMGNANWFMKTYKGDVLISENNIKVTDSIIGVLKIYPSSNTIKGVEPSTILHIMKTEIVD